MATPTFTTLNTEKTYIRNRERTFGVFVPYLPILNSPANPTSIKQWGIMCTNMGLADAPLSVKNEREIQGGGKSVRKINDGYELGDFVWSFMGNSLYGQAAIAGKNLLKEGEYGITQEGDIKNGDEVGAFIVYAYNEDKSQIVRTDVHTRVRAKMVALPGDENDNNYGVTFYHENPYTVSVPYPIGVGVEVWYAHSGGGITNAALPGPAFTLGTGNDSLLVGATDLHAREIDSTKSGYEKNLFGVWKNGVRYGATTVTYTDGVAGLSEGIITLPAATAATGDYLLAIYGIDVTGAGGFTDSTVPSWRLDLDPTTSDDFTGIMQSWSTYMGG